LFSAKTLVGENTNKGGAPDICLFPWFMSSQTTILSSPHRHSPKLKERTSLLKSEDVAGYVIYACW
jgi:hypothetical protein